MESKEAVVERLHFTLLATRAGKDIAEMRYEKLDNGGEFVNITWKSSGMRRVNVAGDSGLALIYDVVRALM